MNNWHPHVTVATVVSKNGRYLLVEERDKMTGAAVFNQPAGHLEANETLCAAALRETREETGWEVALEGMLGMALYTAPSNRVTYCRSTFLASPLRELAPGPMDADIIARHWLSYEEICAMSDRMRSAMVISDLDRARSGVVYPLDFIQNFPLA